MNHKRCRGGQQGKGNDLFSQIELKKWMDDKETEKRDESGGIIWKEGEKDKEQYL